MGLAYYFGDRNFRRALEEFGIALQGLPNDVEVLQMQEYAHRRLGDWDETLALFEKAAQLNPRDANLHRDLGAFAYNRKLSRGHAGPLAQERCLHGQVAPLYQGPPVDGTSWRRPASRTCPAEVALPRPAACRPGAGADTSVRSNSGS